MSKYELTSWLKGDSVPCRIELELEGTPINADATPTISVWDSDGVLQVDGANMTDEATGIYVYYAPTTAYVIGKCYWVASYAVSTVDRKTQNMFFLYDQPTWAIIERIRGALDNLQEGELSSATIYDMYTRSVRRVTPKASTECSAELLADAIYAETELKSYVSYLTDRERASDQIGTAAYIMLGELRTSRDELMRDIARGLTSVADVARGVVGTTESAIQLSEQSDLDTGNYEASKTQ
ncbi:hypothetical protein LCGC14_1203820 [marine sediment metagenome]|uniref:Uncharacterized protein n=1 Tax=marine sediment metagenome TaxID=412755 RepID=A0A0F9LG50_9ZZZZ